MPAKPKKYEERLMDIFRFDEDDLEVNQAGAMSPAQVGSLKAARTRALVAATVLSIFLLALFAILVNATLGSSVVAFVLGIAALAYGGIVAVFGSRVRHLQQDMRLGRVTSVEGRVELSLKNQQNNAAYFIRIDHRRFRVKKEAFLAFKNGDPYRVFYAPYSRQIVSVEWLRDDHPFVEDAPDAAKDVDNEAFTEPRQQTQSRSR